MRSVTLSTIPPGVSTINVKCHYLRPLGIPMLTLKAYSRGRVRKEKSDRDTERKLAVPQPANYEEKEQLERKEQKIR